MGPHVVQELQGVMHMNWDQIIVSVKTLLL